VILTLMASRIDTVRRAYEAWKREDWDAFFELFDRAVVFDVSSFPEGAIYRGHDGIREGWRIWRGTWESYDVDIEGFEERGERIVALTRVRALSKGHGVETTAQGADVWTVRDGSIVRLAIYMDRAGALRAGEASA
jgi:ketosteroid isomerase-like protein